METRPMDLLVKALLLQCGEDGIAASRKKTYFLSTFPEGGMDCPSYWDGGSKSYWTFLKLSTRQVWTMGSNHPFYEAGRPYYVNHLPDDCVLVRTGIFCGKVATAHLYLKEVPRVL